MSKNEQKKSLQPRIVLVDISEAGNIGASARACKNMGLEQLYLVKPKNFPSAAASARASNADDILHKAVVCPDLKTALSGTHLIIGASARERHTKWPNIDVIQAVQLIKAAGANEQQSAVVFGTENSGLSNAQLDLCQYLMSIPSNAAYPSLNVAAAVQVFTYQYLITNKQKKISKNKELTSFDSIQAFYQHLEQALDHINYFDKHRPKALILRRLRRLFAKSDLSPDETAILRGILNKITPYK